MMAKVGDYPEGSNLGETDGSGSSVTGGLSGETNQTSQTQSQMTNQMEVKQLIKI